MAAQFAGGSTSRASNFDDLDSDDADSLKSSDAFHEARSQRADEDDSDTSELDADSEWHDPAGLADAIEQAKAYKVSGNTHFTALRTSSALDDYRLGIACLPVGPIPKPKKPSASDQGKGKGRADEFDDEDDEEDCFTRRHSNGAARPASSNISGSGIRELNGDDDAEEFVNGDQRTQEENDLMEIRSTLWSNIAACHLRTNEYKAAVEAATHALEDQPGYLKALQRRATANDKLNTWTSLSAALKDYEELEQHPDLPTSALLSVRTAKRGLPARIEERKTAETKEMMDKLKGLGNSILGKFGMSTDNFQFVKNEETGGYSMNFVQNNNKGNSKASG